MKRHYLTLILATLFSILNVFADTVVTKEGSTLNGTITLIDQGVIYLDTPYAGKLKLKQEDVASFESATPLNFRLNDGKSILGTVTKNNKTLKIRSDDTTEKTSVEQIAASWAPDETDPEIERNRRKWKNEFAADVNGRTGNVERYNFGAELDLRLKGPDDELHLGLDYEQGEQDGRKTADRKLGQLGYERFNKNKVGWFTRSILETDPINGIELRSTSSYGISYRLINNEVQTFVVRGGLGYRYTEFEDGDPENESTLTVDPGIFHTYKYKDLFYIENELSYSPALDNFNNYTGFHDSSIRLPIGNDGRFWVRAGVRHEYESQTSAAEQLDTNYYSQFIYSWK